MNEGWIKLHRKILDNPIVFKDAEHFAVWGYLLLNATHKEYPALFKGERILLMPGQLLTGRKSIASFLKIAESKVQRVLKKLESEQQIEQQKSNKNRLITIVSWDNYQANEQQTEQQVNNNRTTSEQQVNTNKNVKNNKNDKKNKYGEFKNVALTEKEYNTIAEKYGVDKLKKKIVDLDSYIESTGKKYKSHNATIQAWIRKDIEQNNCFVQSKNNGIHKTEIKKIQRVSDSWEDFV